MQYKHELNCSNLCIASHTDVTVGTTIFEPSYFCIWNPFEDTEPVDFILKWVAITWLKDKPMWGVLCQRHALPRAGTSNCILHYLWSVIICPYVLDASWWHNTPHMIVLTMAVIETSLIGFLWRLVSSRAPHVWLFYTKSGFRESSIAHSWCKWGSCMIGAYLWIFGEFRALQLVLLAAFGVVDEPPAFCTMVHFGVCVFLE